LYINTGEDTRLMDSRINLLNKLKKGLNNLLTREEPNPTMFTYVQDLGIIRSLLLRENIQAGLALNESSFQRSEIYSEVSGDGFKFHIYPELPKSRLVEEEIEAIPAMAQ
jgi:hypothetical protein